MAKKTPPRWRARFLRALRRTGNVRVSAGAAGVDKGTAYAHRRRDAEFAAKWARALETAAAGAAKGPLHRRSGGYEQVRSAPHCAAASGGRGDRLIPRPGEELILRMSKRHGPQLVRAAEGRFDAAVRERFLTTLAATGCVARAVAASGLSHAALSKRRANYPDFAADWAAAEAHAKARLHGFVVAAGIATFDPEAAAASPDAPKVSVAEAIAILRLKGTGPSPALAAAANDAEEPPIEAVRDEVLKRVEAIRRKRAQGRG